MKVRMISPNGQVSIITEAEACAIRNSVFMRPGNVSIQDIELGYQIKDQHGITTLTAILENPELLNSCEPGK